MKVTKLTCPSCGAPINKKTTKCEYCNTNLILENNVFKIDVDTDVDKNDISLEPSRNYDVKLNYDNDNTIKTQTIKRIVLLTLAYLFWAAVVITSFLCAYVFKIWDVFSFKIISYIILSIYVISLTITITNEIYEIKQRKEYKWKY